MSLPDASADAVFTAYFRAAKYPPPPFSSPLWPAPARPLSHLRAARRDVVNFGSFSRSYFSMFQAL